MNIQQKTEIAFLRSKGYGYTKIAQELGLSKNTVKSYCKRNNLSGAAMENAATNGGTHARRQSHGRLSTVTPA